MRIFNSRRLVSGFFVFLLCVPSLVMYAEDNNNNVPIYQNPTVITLSLTAVAAVAAFCTAFCEYKKTKHQALVSKHETKITLIDRLRDIEKNCPDDERRLSLQKRIDELTLSLAESCLNA